MTRSDGPLDNQTPALFGQTPSQTVGPFFHMRLPWLGAADLIAHSSLGARPELLPPGHCLLPRVPDHTAVEGASIQIIGQVFDGEGAPVADALLEIWQANAAGRYHSSADPRTDLPWQPGFSGYGRAASGEDGAFRFRTVMPGRVPGPGGVPQAPHIAVSVLGRGLLKRLVTRIYFEDQPDNDADPILCCVPAARRDTLVARRLDAAAEDVGTYRFDVHLHGQHETVFFAL
jgi:protocatechuate 3,4-dioxygenase alpha subunit